MRLGVPGAWRPWIHICQGCNAEQGDRRFYIWAFDLSLAGDERAARVALVAEFFREREEREES